MKVGLFCSARRPRETPALAAPAKDLPSGRPWKLAGRTLAAWQSPSRLNRGSKL